MIKSSYLSTNEIETKTNKIELEQRRRNELYVKLDYLLSVVTYFDFFSIDTFKIVKLSKEICQIYNFKEVTKEVLFLAFLSSNSQIVALLKEYNITQENILKEVISQNPDNFKNSFKYVNSLEKKLTVTYSKEITFIFEKAAENCLLRFKTPIISSEILFLTLLENDDLPFSFFKKLLGNETNWYLLKYKLVKRIHTEESNIRENITKNQHYFAYLLKSQLTEMEFERLIKNELLTTGVSLFRNTLISKILKVNILDVLNKDIHQSIQVTRNRIYSNV